MLPKTAQLLRDLHAKHTLTEIAQRVGLSVSFLCDVEHGCRHLALGRAAHIARCFDVDPCLWVQAALVDKLQQEGLTMRVEVRP